MVETLAALNTTAMVLGYMVLAALFLFTAWVAGVWYDSWLYRRRRARRHDIEWDNVRSRWLDESIPIERVQTAEQPQTVVDSVDRIDTDVLNATIGQIYDYQEELHRDVS